MPGPPLLRSMSSPSNPQQPELDESTSHGSNFYRTSRRNNLYQTLAGLLSDWDDSVVGVGIRFKFAAAAAAAD